MSIIKSVTLAYFSGTGCTEMAASCFEEKFTELEINVNRLNIAKDGPEKLKKTDLLIVLSPVYAFRLANITEDWVSRLPETASGAKAAIISVSGGGEISPNTACRVPCKRILTKKGYHITYERMLVMPSNFAAPTSEDLLYKVINILPQKIDSIIKDLLAGKTCTAKPLTKDRFIASVGKMEHFGAKFFGASIRASKECNSCGLCAKECPRDNIRMKDGMPKFGFHCMWCLKCIYACPQQALAPKYLKSVVLEGGFDLKKMSRAAEAKKQEPISEITESTLWKGVQDYLKE